MAKLTEDEIFEAFSKPALNILHGVISYENALKQMDIKAITDSMSEALMVAISRQAFSFIQQPDPNWQAAIALQVLLYACVDAMPAPPSNALQEELAWNFVGVASRALWHVPDPWLYQQASTRGEAAVELAKQRDNPQGAGDLLHALGTLNLDPYAANREISRFEQEMQTWQARAAQGETWNHERYYDPVEKGYPSLQQALQTAADYYRQAAKLRQGLNRGLTLKALAQTLYNCHLHALPFDKSELKAAASQALECFDEQQDPAVYMETRRYLNFASDEEADLAAAFPKEWLHHSIDQSINRLGEEKTVQLIVEAYAQVEDYPLLLRILLDAAGLFEGGSREDFYHSSVLRTFIRSLGLKTYDLGNPPEASIETLHAGISQSATAEKWDPARYAASLLSLADLSVAKDAEAYAIQLVDEARDIAPYATQKIADSIAHLRAQLLRNDGVNAYRREDWNQSTRRYAEALSAFIALGETHHISKSLTELSDVVKLGDADAAVSVCLLLEETIDSIELVAGDQVSEQMRTLIEYAVRNLLLHRADTQVLWRLLQLSSARRFAAMLAAGSAYRFYSSQIAPQILQQIHQLRSALLRDGEAVTASYRMTDTILLSPHTVDGIRMSGKNSSEVLANLQHQYDKMLNNALAQTAMGKAGLLATEQDVRAYLAADDVLVQYFIIDASADGQSPATILSVVTTQEESSWTALQFSNQGRVKMEIDGVAVELTDLSTRIESLRQQIQEDPEEEPLSKEAAASIKALSDLLISPIQARLDELHQAGKRHLCFVPPGPLAYIPFHILGTVPGALLAPWIITYLPTLQLLVRNYGGPALLRRRDRSLTACGLSFKDNTLGYDELPEAVSEAIAVAATMHSEPLLDEAATELQLKTAMLSSRYVHIATHGEQNVVAPCFNKLVLAPDDDDDGELHAHELLGMDLRGLQLVTLSACETALGRFDRGLNPHGLPATLLLAGTETVIGTLWEIETSCSERFFTTLYTLLGQGERKYSAYSEALRITRQHHPQFRDWGAFYFLGDWN